jgi:hypothetical protein
VHDDDRLIPKPHMLKSIRSRNWKLEGAIEELVDNSLGHGRASNVDIIIDHVSKAIVVHDDGIGIDDINRIFRYGDASAHDELTEIGQYGVGATNAVVYLGDVTKVHTVRDGRKHVMAVDWAEVERSGEWPKRYRGNGTRPLPDERGTMVVIGELARSRGWHFSTSERMAKEFGRVFAPAVRSRKRIRILHRYVSGQEQLLTVEPFNPPDLTDEVQLAGEVPTPTGVLKWTGRVGLSASLTDRHNGVHIAFGHRVIETTKEPFGTKSAPTLYCEITLDPTTPWKHALSEHKDKVVHHREELMASISAEIEPLLEKSAQQASHLTLHGMTAPIEAALTKALRGAGVLYVDPDEEPEQGGEQGEGAGPIERGDRLHTPKPEGEEAKEANKPTGVLIEWLPRDKLGGKAYKWEVRGNQMIITLEIEQHELTVKFPPNFRDQHVVQLIASYLSHAIEFEYYNDSPALFHTITPKLRKQIVEWAQSDEQWIAPYLNRRILEAAA